MKNYIESLTPVDINLPLQKRYNQIAHRWNQEEYSGLRRDDVLNTIIEKSELDNLGQDSESGVSVLEAMAGTGNVGKAIKGALEEKGKKCKLHYLDFSENMLKQIEIDAEKFLADACMMPFSDNLFDRLYIRFAVHDLPKESQQQLVNEVFRVLKKDGMFVLTAYFTDNETQDFYNKIVNLKDELAGNKGVHDRHFPTKNEYVGLLENAGFENIRYDSDFVGKIEYCKTIELGKEQGEKWKNHVLNMPEDIQRKMNITIEDDGKVCYDFPATIITGTKM